MNDCNDLLWMSPTSNHSYSFNFSLNNEIGILFMCVSFVQIPNIVLVLVLLAKNIGFFFCRNSISLSLSNIDSVRSDLFSSSSFFLLCSVQFEWTNERTRSNDVHLMRNPNYSIHIFLRNSVYFTPLRVWASAAHQSVSIHSDPIHIFSSHFFFPFEHKL